MPELDQHETAELIETLNSAIVELESIRSQIYAPELTSKTRKAVYGEIRFRPRYTELGDAEVVLAVDALRDRNIHTRNKLDAIINGIKEAIPKEVFTVYYTADVRIDGSVEVTATNAEQAIDYVSRNMSLYDVDANPQWDGNLETDDFTIDDTTVENVNAHTD